MQAKPYDSNLLLKPFSDPLEAYELECNGKDRTHQNKNASSWDKILSL